MLKKWIAVCLFLPMLALATQVIEGKDYVVLKGSEGSKGQAKVTEFFSYGCPWCYRIETGVNLWLKGQKDIVFKRVPVVFNKDWELYARAFYIAEALSMQEKLSPALFKAIQIDKQSLNNKQAMIQFFVAQGVEKSLAESAFDNASSIDFALQNGKQLMARYQIKAVPAFVVNGQYKTDLAMARDINRLFEILNFLIKKDSKASEPA